MAFESIAGSLTSRLWANPVSGVAATFGAGAGLYAGASTFITTDGSAGEKADAAASSAIGYGVTGAGLVLGVGVVGATAAAFRAGRDGYGKLPKGMFGPERRVPINESVGYGAAKGVKGIPNLGRRTANSVGSYFQGVAQELRTPGGWKTALQRPGISGGLGALVGGAIGSQVSDDPTKGAVVGAAVGAGAGVAIGRAAKASQAWGKWGSLRRGGSIVAASIALGGALKILSGSDPEAADRATPEDNGYSNVDSGIRDRMSRIGAQGDLVFGLHNKR